MLKKDDVVQVIAGRDKGKIGKVLRMNDKSMRITVEKVNLVKRHTKPTQKAPQGGIIEKEIPIHYSNVLLMCAKCNKGVRYGIKMGEASSKKARVKKGERAAPAGAVKMRVCKKCGTSLERQ